MNILQISNFIVRTYSMCIVLIVLIKYFAGVNFLRIAFFKGFIEKNLQACIPCLYNCTFFVEIISQMISNLENLQN